MRPAAFTCGFGSSVSWSGVVLPGPTAAYCSHVLLGSVFGVRDSITTDPTQDRRDRYGRLLAYVDTPGRTGATGSVNYALVAPPTPRCSSSTGTRFVTRGRSRRRRPRRYGAASDSGVRRAEATPTSGTRPSRLPPGNGASVSAWRCRRRPPPRQEATLTERAEDRQRGGRPPGSLRWKLARPGPNRRAGGAPARGLGLRVGVAPAGRRTIRAKVRPPTRTPPTMRCPPAGLPPGPGHRG